MGRKSSIDKLPSDVRAHIEKRLRENRLTLDELFADVREAFPDLAAPSRSALGRYRMGFEEIMQTQRAMSTAASALIDVDRSPRGTATTSRSACPFQARSCDGFIRAERRT